MFSVVERLCGSGPAYLMIPEVVKHPPYTTHIFYNLHLVIMSSQFIHSVRFFVDLFCAHNIYCMFVSGSGIPPPFITLYIMQYKYRETQYKWPHIQGCNFTSKTLLLLCHAGTQRNQNMSHKGSKNKTLQ